MDRLLFKFAMALPVPLCLACNEIILQGTIPIDHFTLTKAGLSIGSIACFSARNIWLKYYFNIEGKESELNNMNKLLCISCAGFIYLLPAWLFIIFAGS